MLIVSSGKVFFSVSSHPDWWSHPVFLGRYLAGSFFGSQGMKLNTLMHVMMKYSECVLSASLKSHYIWYKDILFNLDSRTHYFFWFTSCCWISSLILFIAAVKCPGSSPCSVFSSSCFFLLVVVTLLLAQWLNSLGIKYQTFTLLMWTTLLSRIGR